MKTIKALEPYGAVMEAVTSTQWASTMVQMLRASGDSLYFHSFNVALLTANLALFGNREVLAENGIALSSLILGAYLHDIGYIAAGNTEACHKKREMMTYAEQIAFGRHIELGLTQIRTHTDDAIILDIVSMHHEYINGSGYPNGRRGDELGPHVRLVSLAHDLACYVENMGYESSGQLGDIIADLQGYLKQSQPDPKYDLTLARNFLDAIVTYYNGLRPLHKSLHDIDITETAAKTPASFPKT